MTPTSHPPALHPHPCSNLPNNDPKSMALPLKLIISRHPPAPCSPAAARDQMLQQPKKSRLLSPPLLIHVSFAVAEFSPFASQQSLVNG